jgi:DnaJ family protein C protein 3
MTVGQFAGAAEDYEAVLRTNPTHADAKKMLAIARECAVEVAAAEDMTRQDRWGEAEQQLNHAILATTCDCPHLKMLRASARFMQGNFVDAIADAGEVLKTEKQSVDALLLRGKAFHYTANKEMTLLHLRDALKFDPDHKDTKAFYKQVKRLHKLFDGAEAELLSAELGKGINNQNNQNALVTALEGYRAALLIDPTNDAISKTLHLRVCKCEMKLGHEQQAVEACKRASQIDHTLLDAYIMPAKIILKKKAKKSAHFEEAISFSRSAVDVCERIAKSDSNREKCNKVFELMRRAEAGKAKIEQKNHKKGKNCLRSAEGECLVDLDSVGKSTPKFRVVQHPWGQEYVYN